MPTMYIDLSNLSLEPPPQFATNKCIGIKMKRHWKRVLWISFLHSSATHHQRTAIFTNTQQGFNHIMFGHLFIQFGYLLSFPLLSIHHPHHHHLHHDSVFFKQLGPWKPPWVDLTLLHLTAHNYHYYCPMRGLLQLCTGTHCIECVRPPPTTCFPQLQTMANV